MRSTTRRPAEPAQRRLDRPVPDEAPPLDDTATGRADRPQVTDLSARDYRRIVGRAVRSAIDDQISDAAAAVAYFTFLAMPALLLISVGVFSVFAGPAAIERIIDKLDAVIPPEAISLVETSLQRTTQEGGGLVMIVVGGVVALWTASGAANAVMRALNRVYDCDESRGFVKQRLVGVAMVVVSVLAFVLVFGLLVLGPKLSGWAGDAVGAENAVRLAWLLGQWPILVAGLLLAFAAVLFLGPDRDQRRWGFLSFSSVLAVVLWLVASTGFALFVSSFGSYNKAWGSLAAVIVMLTWLWLSSLTLLFAAEVDAEAERTRDDLTRYGTPPLHRP
jgi:membrane protein